MKQEMRDPLKNMYEDILYGSERKKQKKDRQKQSLEMIVALGTFIGSGIFFLNYMDYLPDSIKRILYAFRGGVGALCVLLASVFVGWVSLILFDIIYKKIVD